MPANDKQIGGQHYKSTKLGEVQHWDYALKLPYLDGLATKYIDRHRVKHGKEDLLKAIHTIEKMIETYYPDDVTPSQRRANDFAEVNPHANFPLDAP